MPTSTVLRAMVVGLQRLEDIDLYPISARGSEVEDIAEIMPAADPKDGAWQD